MKPRSVSASVVQVAPGVVRVNASFLLPGNLETKSGIVKVKSRKKIQKDVASVLASTDFGYSREDNNDKALPILEAE